MHKLLFFASLAVISHLNAQTNIVSVILFLSEHIIVLCIYAVRKNVGKERCRDKKLHYSLKLIFIIVAAEYQSHFKASAACLRYGLYFLSASSVVTFM